MDAQPTNAWKLDDFLLSSLKYHLVFQVKDRLKPEILYHNMLWRHKKIQSTSICLLIPSKTLEGHQSSVSGPPTPSPVAHYGSGGTRTSLFLSSSITSSGSHCPPAHNNTDTHISIQRAWLPPLPHRDCGIRTACCTPSIFTMLAMFLFCFSWPTLPANSNDTSN